MSTATVFVTTVRQSVEVLTDTLIVTRTVPDIDISTVSDEVPTPVTLSGSGATLPSSQASPAGTDVSSPESKARSIAIAAGAVAAFFFLIVVFICIRSLLPYLGRFRERAEGLMHGAPTQNNLLQAPDDGRQTAGETGPIAITATRDAATSENPIKDAGRVRQIEGGMLTQRVPTAVRPIPLPGADYSFLSTRDRVSNNPDSSGQAVSLMMQEIQNLQARVDELVRRQHQEAARRITSTGSDDGDSREAPPSYGENRC